jgi:haloalkane dehalogenase
MSGEVSTRPEASDDKHSPHKQRSAYADLYPFSPHFLEVPGARLHFLDEGHGQLVVMLHGNPTWSFYYRDLVKALREEYRVIVPDHVGCGLSEKPEEERYEYTLDRRVADLETLLESLGLTSGVTLVLHDWGGMIGMAFASRHPERIKRLVILNTAAFLLPEGKRLPWSLWLCRNTPLGPLLIRGFNAFSRGAVRYCSTRGLEPAVRAAYLAPYDSWSHRIAVLRFVQDIPLGPSDRAYATVRAVQDGLERFRDLPMLICWGERDFVFDGAFLAEWRRRFPKAEVHRFPDAGHFVLEDAGAAIVPLVREFLQHQPPAPNES